MLEKYPEAVKVVFKNFPLRNHRYAQPAALAAMAANMQGRFWPVHDALFASYNRLDEKAIRRIVEEAGTDMEQFEKDLKSGRPQYLVTRDVREALEAGVRGTPTIFVGGRRLENRSLEGFEAVIERILEARRR